MNSSLRQQIQSACDDVHRDPDDVAALGRLQRLLSTEAADAVNVSQDTWRRLVKIACDELYDDPDNTDTRDLLLFLLTARASMLP